jgi:hypothetical protein
MLYLLCFGPSAGGALPAPLPCNPQPTVIVNPTVLADRRRLINSLKARFPLFDDVLAEDALEEAGWSFLRAFDVAEGSMSQRVARPRDRGLRDGTDPLFQELRAAFPAFSADLVAAAIHRADFVEDEAREYLESDSLRSSLESDVALEAPATLPSLCDRLPHSNPIPVVRSLLRARCERRNTFTKDLHGMTVAEAYEAVTGVMQQICAENQGGRTFWHKVNFICGRGNDSPGGLSRIRPAVLWAAQEFGCARRIMARNPGIVEVLPPGIAWEDLPPLGQDNRIVCERVDRSRPRLILGSS